MNAEIKLGDKVQKMSGKPFKSQLKVNTVKEFTINESTGKPSLLFEEDESSVEAFRYEKVL